MRECDTTEWKQGVDEKSSFRIYREWRAEIGGQEKIQDNRQASDILFKCRTNTLKLNVRNIFLNEDTKCEMCGNENEDLKYYFLLCPAYSADGQKSIKLQQPYQEEENNIIGDLLFEKKTLEKQRKQYRNSGRLEKIRRQRIDQDWTIRHTTIGKGSAVAKAKLSTNN